MTGLRVLVWLVSLDHPSMSLVTEEPVLPHQQEDIS